MILKGNQAAPAVILTGKYYTEMEMADDFSNVDVPVETTVDVPYEVDEPVTKTKTLSVIDMLMGK